MHVLKRLIGGSTIGISTVFCARIALLNSETSNDNNNNIPPTRKPPQQHQCTKLLSLQPNCDEIKVFSGTSHPEYALSIAKNLGILLSPAQIGRYADGEISVRIDTSVRGKDCYVIQPTGPPVSDNLMELLFMCSALREASAKKVTAIVPYFGYMRSDGTFQRPPRNSNITTTAATYSEDENNNNNTHRTSYLAMADVAKMLEVAGCSCLVTVDLHASGQSVAEGFFNSTIVENIRSGRYVGKKIVQALDVLKSAGEDLVVISSHSLCFSKAKKLQEYLKEELPNKNVGLALVIRNSNTQNNNSSSIDLVGDVQGKNVLIVEDIIDTGRSITRAANAARDAGASHIFAFASHALLTQDGAETLQNCAPLEKVLVMNTCPISLETKNKCGKLELVDSSFMIAEMIEKLHLVPVVVKE